MKSKPTSPPQTIDAFLATVRPDQRAALEKLRRTIRAAAPPAVECINYGVPSFRVDGKQLVSFGATARHCAFYPGTTVQDFLPALSAYETSKGTIRFQPATPLPAALVRQLVKARLAQMKRPGAGA